jgi:hypothetical protein
MNAAVYNLSPHRISSRWLVALIVFGLSACDRSRQSAGPTRREIRQAGLSYLDGNIGALEKELAESPDEREDARFRLKQFKRARAWLESQPVESQIAPYPIIAGLNKTAGRQYAVSLSWLESGYDAHGLTLTDADGVIGTFDHCFPVMSAAEKDARKSTPVRTMTVFFTAGDGADVNEKQPNDFHVGRPLNLPPLKVRIRSGDGMESVEIEAQINWATVERGGAAGGRNDQ